MTRDYTSISIFFIISLALLHKCLSLALSTPRNPLDTHSRSSSSEREKLVEEQHPNIHLDFSHTALRSALRCAPAINRLWWHFHVRFPPPPLEKPSSLLLLHEKFILFNIGSDEHWHWPEQQQQHKKRVRDFNPNPIKFVKWSSHRFINFYD
jgi:hypothetical protein